MKNYRHINYGISPYRFLLNCFFVLTVLLVIVYSCGSNKSGEESFYLNHHDTVDYVGLATCASCHEDKAKTFVHTGMGSSFHLANRQKSAADFDKVHIIYDTLNDLYYKPYWESNTLFFMEYRLEGKDTVHKRIEKIDYIIGSGQHTNSHLVLRNGFVYQAPLTWYAQEKHWGLPPGFESGRNSRFARVINEECMSCHNAMPQVEKGSDNKFTKIGLGIDCERCHGPGELHVKLRLKGKPILSEDGIDRSIVNPAKLTWQRQVDLCQRCHLQGNAVLKGDKKFTDFKPGMILSDHMDVFMPDYENRESGFIMASHAQRLQMSRCFVQSNKGKNKQSLTCINCHNPHITVRETGADQFNKACKKCHPGKDACKELPGILEQNNNNCVKCHIPPSGASDIPHVTVHDHYIRKPSKMVPRGHGQLKGLYCINNDNPDIETKIKAYLSYYEKFDPNDLYLKEARKMLNKHSDHALEIYYWYLAGNSDRVIAASKKADEKNLDAWGLYRIGQSYLNKTEYPPAENYLLKALKGQPLNFEFIYKLSIASHNLGNSIEEERLLKQVISLNPDHTQALNNLGYFYFKRGETGKAFIYYQRSLKTNPDFVPVLKNLFDYYVAVNNRIKAVDMARRILKKEPGNKVLNDFLSS